MAERRLPEKGGRGEREPRNVRYIRIQRAVFGARVKRVLRLFDRSAGTNLGAFQHFNKALLELEKPGPKMEIARESEAFLKELIAKRQELIRELGKAERSAAKAGMQSEFANRFSKLPSAVQLQKLIGLYNEYLEEIEKKKRQRNQGG